MLLTLEEVIEGITPIVEADPTFVYPRQGDDVRCKCVEQDADDADYYDTNYNNSDCSWHFDDDSTCLYLKDGTTTAPACVLGHYFLELGIPNLHTWESKAPTVILDANGYEVEPRAQRFLNSVQSNQDQGQSWGEAFDQALVSARGPQWT
jgi:hypothetical protein